MIILDSIDTIAAISSPSGPSERGIIRLSGANAVPLAFGSFDYHGFQTKGRSSRVEGYLRVASVRSKVSAALIVWPNARSYTGEPTAEIHTIGSPPILQAILQDLVSRGARLAEPGEFTLRAFLSGRIDLTRAEAVLAVIEARHPFELDVALAQLAGGIAKPIYALRDRLLEVLAHLEANLDFAEEPDVDPLSREKLRIELAAATTELLSLAIRIRALDRSEEVPRVVLVGPPNAGKSRLFNCLVGTDRAIVSPIAGTTRDYLSARIACSGMTIELVDTAGTDSAGSSIERQSQEFRQEQLTRADLILVCHPADSVADFLEEIKPGRPFLHVLTKVDLGDAEIRDVVRTSSLSREGLSDLKHAIYRELNGTSREGGAVLETSVRCRDSLGQASEALQSASVALQRGLGDELVAVDLRETLNELGRVVGSVVTDDILDHIFSRFCIGK